MAKQNDLRQNTPLYEIKEYESDRKQAKNIITALDKCESVHKTLNAAEKYWSNPSSKIVVVHFYGLRDNQEYRFDMDPADLYNYMLENLEKAEKELKKEKESLRL